MLALLRIWLRFVSAVAPGFAARQVRRLWFRVGRFRVTDEARAFLETGQRFDVDVKGTRVVAWRWGSGPAVLLMHGWGGSGSQMLPFVEPLVRAGYEVITFDAPSHGESGPSAMMGPGSATLFDFADGLVALAKGGSPAGVIAHSGGCAGTAWAMVTTKSFRPKRIVFVAPFGHPRRYMDGFSEMLGASADVMDRFRALTEAEFGFKWADFDVPAMADRAETPPLLVVHDKNDRETSWQDGADIAARWPNATMETTTGLGHNRILRDPRVIELAVGHIKG